MKHDPYFTDLMLILRPLLREHQPTSVLSFDSLCDYVAWYWNRGTISYVIDEFGTAHAVCLIKLFRRLEQFLEPFVHDPCGQFVMLELMAADEPNAMGEIFDELSQRWGPQRVVMWERGERTATGAPRMYSWPQFRKLARRLTYGVTEHV